MPEPTSQLTAFYQALRGLDLSQDELATVARLEEKIIREQVLPALAENIAPALSEIKRDLTLVVDYHPGQSLSVSLSRRRNITEMIDATRLTPDPIEPFEPRGRQQRVNPRNPRMSLAVTMPNGDLVIERNATQTYIKVLRQIGLQRVRDLRLVKSALPVVSTEIDPNRKDRQKLYDGYYINTGLSTSAKSDVINEVATRLGLDIHAEAID